MFAFIKQPKENPFVQQIWLHMDFRISKILSIYGLSWRTYFYSRVCIDILCAFLCSVVNCALQRCALIDVVFMIVVRLTPNE